VDVSASADVSDGSSVPSPAGGRDNSVVPAAQQQEAAQSNRHTGIPTICRVRWPHGCQIDQFSSILLPLRGRDSKLSRPPIERQRRRSYPLGSRKTDLENISALDIMESDNLIPQDGGA
jgi:hypothetical protein